MAQRAGCGVLALGKQEVCRWLAFGIGLRRCYVVHSLLVYRTLVKRGMYSGFWTDWRTRPNVRGNTRAAGVCRISRHLVCSHTAEEPCPFVKLFRRRATG
ncbi:hypothetical protein OH77DRAFT_66358 [Trametes cingulata]|nr:hypothetical protein OH77DRAFT_66358 [Trametes cingulata]